MVLVLQNAVHWLVSPARVAMVQLVLKSKLMKSTIMVINSRNGSVNVPPATWVQHVRYPFARIIHVSMAVHVFNSRAVVIYVYARWVNMGTIVNTVSFEILKDKHWKGRFVDYSTPYPIYRLSSILICSFRKQVLNAAFSIQSNLSFEFCSCLVLL